MRTAPLLLIAWTAIACGCGGAAHDDGSVADSGCLATAVSGAPCQQGQQVCTLDLPCQPIWICDSTSHWEEAVPNCGGSPDDAGAETEASPTAPTDTTGCGSPVMTYQCDPVLPDAAACVGPTADGGTGFYPIGCVAAEPGCTAATVPASPIECTCTANVAPGAFGDAQAVFICLD